MRLYSEYIRKYPQDFITVVEALSHTGALAIQNASMYKALKEDKRSLEEDIWSHRHYFGSSGLSVLLGIAQYHRLVEEIEKQKT
ncbi:MAG: hypothetical protein GY799_06190, partial [Desulfobulbaceae bacterium]|nr:hypothetical protein [Desulfobulbaceae bacterium]